MKKCSDCKGSRQVMGLGFVYKDCVKCEGSGFQFEEEVVVKAKPKKKKAAKHEES